MKLLIVSVSVVLLTMGCGKSCYYGKLQLAHQDLQFDGNGGPGLDRYQVVVDDQRVPLAVLPDGTFQVCDLKSKRPDKLTVLLEGKRVLSAATFAQKGGSSDPWIIRVAGPIGGEDIDIDTTWVPPIGGKPPIPDSK